MNRRLHEGKRAGAVEVGKNVGWQEHNSGVRGRGDRAHLFGEVWADQNHIGVGTQLMARNSAW